LRTALRSWSQEREALSRSNPLFRIFQRARAIFEDFLHSDMDEVRQYHPNLRRDDRLHWLIYDPLVPMTDELQLMRPCTLVEQYHRLADAIMRATPGLT
jgi:hypothetical protein